MTVSKGHDIFIYMSTSTTEGSGLLPSFEIIQVPSTSENPYTLRLLSNLPNDLKSSLISTLSSEKPTQLGEPLGMGSRANYGFVRKVDLHDGKSVMLKRAFISLMELRQRDIEGQTWKEYSRWGNVELVEELQRDYFHETGHQLKVEQVIGILDENTVNENNREKRDRYYWTIYQYYLPATEADFPHLQDQMKRKRSELETILDKLGYQIADRPQLIPIVGENHTLDFVLIDTEALRKITA